MSKGFHIYIVIAILLLLTDCHVPITKPNHLDSLRAKYAVSFNEDGCDYGEPTFLDYVINRILPDTSYTKYLTDRTLMRKLKLTACQDGLVKVEDKLDDGRTIMLSFITSSLDTNAHAIERKGRSGYIVESIDGKYPYGANHWNENYKPQRFNLVEILAGGEELTVPEDAFSNLYNVTQCRSDGWSWMRPIEVYTEDDQIYIYLYGGNAADTYFAKVVFNKDKYITTLVADYGPLPCYGAFRPNFPAY